MKKWTKKLGIKCLKTGAQALLGAIGSTALITDLNWTVALSTSAMAILVCILMNLADLKE